MDVQHANRMAIESCSHVAAPAVDHGIVCFYFYLIFRSVHIFFFTLDLLLRCEA